MLRALVLTAVVAALCCANALAAGLPGVKATVKEGSSSVTVTIVNNSGKSYKGYFMNSTDKPVITGASDKSCKHGTSPWKDNAGKSHTDYWENCTGTLGAHKTLVITLTTHGGTGTIWVDVGSGTQRVEVFKGT